MTIDVTSADDLSLSPDDVAARLTPRTRAIIVVHYGGHAADMGAILALAERHGLDAVSYTHLTLPTSDLV